MNPQWMYTIIVYMKINPQHFDQHKDLISLKELYENIIGFYDIDEDTPTNEELVDFVKKKFS